MQSLCVELKQGCSFFLGTQRLESYGEQFCYVSENPQIETKVLWKRSSQKQPTGQRFWGRTNLSVFGQRFWGRTNLSVFNKGKKRLKQRSNRVYIAVFVDQNNNIGFLWRERNGIIFQGMSGT